MKRDFLVNRNIRRVIEENDKKRTAVADKAGMRRDTFSRIVQCKRPVYADEICPIAAALGVPIDELFKEEQQAG